MGLIQNVIGKLTGQPPTNDQQQKPEDVNDLKNRLRDYYKEAKDAMEPRRKKWKENYQYYTNTRIPKGRPKHKSDTRVNYCWVVIEIKTPVMTQSKPTVNFISFENTPEGNRKAEIQTKLIGNALWNKLNVQDSNEDVCKNGGIYDAGVWKVGWDPSVDNGVGEVYVTSLDPFKFLPDPMAKTVQDARYVIHVEPKALSYLKKQYPQFADKIKVDKEISDILYEDRATGDRTLSSGVITDTTRFKVERAYVKEFWTAVCEEDQSILEQVDTEQQQNEVPMVDPTTGQPILDDVTGDPKTTIQNISVAVQAPKYRNGRIITMIGDVIVDDKPNPYKHGKKPFVMQKMNKIPNEFWGIGDIEQIPTVTRSTQPYLAADGRHCYQESQTLAGE